MTCDFSHFFIASAQIKVRSDESGEISMGENHPSEYFTVFEGTYSKICPVNRRPTAAPKPQTNAKGRVAITLALLVLGAGTAAAALTASQQANVAGPSWQHSATFINLPGVVGFEDALY